MTALAVSALWSQAGSTSERAADLTNSTEDLHQGALELLTFLSNMTTNINGRR